jgi:hypothetical protein
MIGFHTDLGAVIVVCAEGLLFVISHVCRSTDPDLQGVFLARACAIWEFRRRMMILFLITGAVSRHLYWNPPMSIGFKLLDVCHCCCHGSLDQASLTQKYVSLIQI